MADLIDAKIKEFLLLYEALCKKYGVQIEGCGCCLSPWIQETKYIISDTPLADHMLWLRRHFNENPTESELAKVEELKNKHRPREESWHLKKLAEEVHDVWKEKK